MMEKGDGIVFTWERFPTFTIGKRRETQLEEQGLSKDPGEFYRTRERCEEYR